MAEQHKSGSVIGFEKKRDWKVRGKGGILFIRNGTTEVRSDDVLSRDNWLIIIMAVAREKIIHTIVSKLLAMSRRASSPVLGCETIGGEKDSCN